MIFLKPYVISIDENIGNHGYIDNLILHIYWIYWRNINGYFEEKKLICHKLIKLHGYVKTKLIAM